MNLELKLKLQKKIIEWANESCENEIWTDEFVGEDLEKLMTDAASTVFDATVSIQKYLKDVGELKK